MLWVVRSGGSKSNLQRIFVFVASAPRESASPKEYWKRSHQHRYSVARDVTGMLNDENWSTEHSHAPQIQPLLPSSNKNEPNRPQHTNNDSSQLKHLPHVFCLLVLSILIILFFLILIDIPTIIMDFFSLLPNSSPLLNHMAPTVQTHDTNLRRATCT